MKNYLFSVIAAAILISLFSALPQKKGISKMVRLCCALFLFIVLLKPFVHLEWEHPERWFSEYQPEEDVISQAVADREKETAVLITRQTEEYILDKAEELGFSPEVAIDLAALSEHYQYPYRVTVRGQWTQGQREALSQYIAQTLGIPEERQIWNDPASGNVLPNS